jgi:hypothetical protein
MFVLENYILTCKLERLAKHGTSDTLDKKIQAFLSSFRELRQDFDSGTGVQVWTIVRNIDEKFNQVVRRLDDIGLLMVLVISYCLLILSNLQIFVVSPRSSCSLRSLVQCGMLVAELVAWMAPEDTLSMTLCCGVLM